MSQTLEISERRQFVTSLEGVFVEVFQPEPLSFWHQSPIIELCCDACNTTWIAHQLVWRRHGMQDCYECGAKRTVVQIQRRK